MSFLLWCCAKYVSRLFLSTRSLTMLIFMKMRALDCFWFLCDISVWISLLFWVFSACMDVIVIRYLISENLSSQSFPCARTLPNLVSSICNSTRSSKPDKKDRWQPRVFTLTKSAWFRRRRFCNILMHEWRIIAIPSSSVDLITQACSYSCTLCVQID